MVMQYRLLDRCLVRAAWLFRCLDGVQRRFPSRSGRWDDDGDEFVPAFWLGIQKWKSRLAMWGRTGHPPLPGPSPPADPCPLQLQT
jgi:hypothetical protein